MLTPLVLVAICVFYFVFINALLVLSIFSTHTAAPHSTVSYGCGPNGTQKTEHKILWICPLHSMEIKYNELLM